MLTKNDLQQIRNVFHDELDVAIEQQIRPIIKEELKPIKKKLNRVEKDLSYVIKTFDTRIVENAREVQKIKALVGMTQ